MKFKAVSYKICLLVITLWILNSFCWPYSYEQNTAINNYLFGRMSSVFYNSSNNLNNLNSKEIQDLILLLNETDSFNKVLLKMQNIMGATNTYVIKYCMKREIVADISKNVTDQKDIHQLGEYLLSQLRLISVDGTNEYTDNLIPIRSFCLIQNSNITTEINWLINSIHQLPGTSYLGSDIRELLEINIMRDLLDRGDIQVYTQAKKQLLFIKEEEKRNFETSWSIKTTIYYNIQHLKTHSTDTIAMGILIQTIINELRSPNHPWDKKDMDSAINAICQSNSKQAIPELVKFVNLLERLPSEKFTTVAVDIRIELESNIINELSRLNKIEEASQVIEYMKLYNRIRRDYLKNS